MPGLLAAARPACTTSSQCCVQVGGSPLGRRRPELTLVLQLKADGEATGPKLPRPPRAPCPLPRPRRTCAPHTGSSRRCTPGDCVSWRPPEATSASRSRRLWSRPHSSTAETRTEKRVPVRSLRSPSSRKSQEMVQGTTPRLCGELSFPIMVYDWPGAQGARHAQASASPPSPSPGRTAIADRPGQALTNACLAKGEDAAVSPTDHSLQHVGHGPRADLSLGRTDSRAGAMAKASGVGHPHPLAHMTRARHTDNTHTLYPTREPLWP